MNDQPIDESTFEQIKGSLLDGILEKSFEIEAIEEQKSALAYLPPLEGESEEAMPLFDEQDRDILLHRDAHFSSNFSFMIDYYINEGKGAVLDVDIEKIQELAALQEQLGRDLAPLLLQGADAEKIARSRSLYKILRQQCEHPESEEAKACAELILSEEDSYTDAEAIAKLGQKIVPYLIELLSKDILLDPLFPGYGMAPAAAAYALGILKSDAAIPALFMMIGSCDFDNESACLASLAMIGDTAKRFCLNQLTSRPITKDTERAAVALSHFELTEEEKKLLFTMLQDPQVNQKKSLVMYLQAACENY